MQDTEQTEDDVTEEQPQRVPGQMGDMAGQPPEMTEETEQTADTAEVSEQTKKVPEQMGDMPQRGEQGQRDGGHMGAMSRVTWQDAAPALAACGGIFLLGFGYLLYFRRRRRLSIPKQEEKRIQQNNKIRYMEKHLYDLYRCFFCAKSPIVYGHFSVIP